jgi:hypothetical protein
MHAKSNHKMLLKMAEVSRVLNVKSLLLWYAELEVTKAMMSQRIQIIEHP